MKVSLLMGSLRYVSKHACIYIYIHVWMYVMLCYVNVNVNVM